MESVKYHYRVLMIKDLFQMMGFIRPAHFHKDLKKNSFSHMTIKKKNCSQITEIQKDSHK